MVGRQSHESDLGGAGGGGCPVGPGQLAGALAVLSDPVFLMRPIRDDAGRVVDLLYVYVNPASERLYGMKGADIVGHTQFELFPSVRGSALLDGYCRTISTGQPGETEVPTFDENGVVGSFMLEYSMLDGDLLVVARDITAQRQAEAVAEARAGRLQAVLDGSDDGIGVYGPDLRFTYVNRRVEELSGMAADRWVGSTHRELGYPEEQARVWESHIARVFETGLPETFTYDVDNLEGTHQWWEAQMTPEFAADGAVAHVISANRNVTARVRAEERLRELVTHDALTGLVNRVGLVEEVDRGLRARARSGRSLAVVMLDLDRFKFVNDSLGHSAGDGLIKAAAERVVSAVRGGDVVARTGGDEFVIVMRDLASSTEAVVAAERLVSDFRDPFVVNGEEMYATVSVGVALATGQATAEELLRDVDSALFAAKGAGRDRVHVFNDDLRAAAARRLALEADLRRALERGELEVWYQPEVELSSGRTVAAEALLRWRRPDGTVLGADRFVDVAEETGQIRPIGDWVFREACATAAAWLGDGGSPFTVRVNFSAVQLEDVGILARVRETLQETGIDPRCICAEITETVLLHGLDIVRRNLVGFHDLGLGIAIDDFGTGYASLTYLSQYPISVLKIDRSFTQRLVADPAGERLVAGLVALAREVGVVVTAEGVEQEAEADVLRRLGCPTAQGYLYSRAVPAAEFVTMRTRTFPHG